MSKKKHWDFEDDHDWDDDYDYKAHGYGYWYGKYIPQEDIDRMCAEPEPFYYSLLALLAIGGVTFIVGKAVSIVRDYDWFIKEPKK